MRRMIIILSILLVAGSAGAAFPVDFHCASDPDHPKEAEFCRVIKVQFAATGMVVYEFDQNKPHFRIVVLPTARGDHISVTIASTFIYPPLDGLALSVFLSSYLLVPCSDAEFVSAAEYMAKQNVMGVSRWMVWFGGKTGKPRSGFPVEAGK